MRESLRMLNQRHLINSHLEFLRNRRFDSNRLASRQFFLFTDRITPGGIKLSIPLFEISFDCRKDGSTNESELG